MGFTEGMETFAARLASFSVAHPTTKKRASNAKGARALKWPHKAPTPTQLAQAGFFYHPTTSCPDNATCYLCQKGLDGWEEDDDPVAEHLRHSPECGWAINKGIEQDPGNHGLGQENPLSEKMTDARKLTFSNMWPHDAKRGWVCRTQKMAEAGWYYCPVPESDDFVKCPYCSLSLDGWEPKDDPFDEHQRRSPDCAFFVLSASLTPKQSKSKKTRGSKASRVSTQSAMTAVSDDQSVLDLRAGDDDGISKTDADTTLTSAAPKGGKNGRSKKGRGKTQEKTAKPKTDDTPITSSFIEPEDDDLAVKVGIVPAKKTRGKKRTSDEMSSESTTTTLTDTVPIDVESAAPPAKRRTTRQRSSTLQSSTIPEANTEGRHDSHSDMIDPEAISPTSHPRSKKAMTGGRKRASSTTRKASSASSASKASLRAAVPDDEEIEAALEADLDRPLTDEEDEKNEVEGVNNETNQATAIRKPSQGKPASKAPIRKTTRASKKVAAMKKAEPFQLSSPSNPIVNVEQPAPVVNIPSRTDMPTLPQPLPVTASFSSPSRHQEAVPSPTPSPQSSDAENHPPSSRPPQHRPPLAGSSPSKPQVTRVPLAASTPNTSPSRRNPSSRLQTTYGWTAVNLETIFRDMLSTKNENDNRSSIEEMQGIEQVFLTSPEKKMTVEEWIYHNARKGEERLRDECERLVGKFEGEGVRAMKSLEGIVCAE